LFTVDVRLIGRKAKMSRLKLLRRNKSTKVITNYIGDGGSDALLNMEVLYDAWQNEWEYHSFHHVLLLII
jgi:hypothetical protein